MSVIASICNKTSYILYDLTYHYVVLHVYNLRFCCRPCIYSLVSGPSDQHFTVVVSFDSENIPSLLVDVMVSASYDVLSC